MSLLSGPYINRWPPPPAVCMPTYVSHVVLHRSVFTPASSCMRHRLLGPLTVQSVGRVSTIGAAPCSSLADGESKSLQCLFCQNIVLFTIHNIRSAGASSCISCSAGSYSNYSGSQTFQVGLTLLGSIGRQSQHIIAFLTLLNCISYLKRHDTI